MPVVVVVLLVVVSVVVGESLGVRCTKWHYKDLGTGSTFDAASLQPNPELESPNREPCILLHTKKTLQIESHTSQEKSQPG